MAKQTTSWLNYMGGLQHRRFSKEELDIDGIDQIKNLQLISPSMFNYSVPWIYLLDYTSGKYMSVSQSLQPMLGYKMEDFLEGGVNFTLENYQQKHLHLFNEEIFPDRLKFLKNIPAEQHHDYIFSYNFQFKNRKGEYVNLLQRSRFIKSDANRNPLISFGVITILHHFNSKTPLIQVIEKVNPFNTLDSAQTIFKKSYYPDKEDHLFTRREKELLPYLGEGLCSKEIAHKLCISEYTVINHRRNMMLKTGSSNITQLMYFALTHFLL